MSLSFIFCAVVISSLFNLQVNCRPPFQGFETLHEAQYPTDLPVEKYPDFVDWDEGKGYGVVWDKNSGLWKLGVFNLTVGTDNLQQKNRQLLQTNNNNNNNQEQSQLMSGSKDVDPSMVFNLTQNDNSQQSPQIFESIVEGDDRLPVPNSDKFPFDMIGKVEMTCPCQQNTCTGTLIGPRIVLTAGHCIYDINACITLQESRCCQNPCWDFTYLPAYEYGPNPKYGKFEVLHSVLAAGFINGYNQGASVREYGQFDVAVLILKDPVPLNYMSVYYSCDILYETLFLSGYPLDKEDGQRQYYTLCDQEIDACEGNQVFYHTCDTLGGMSGATLWATDKKNNKVVIRGIHSAGVGASPSGLRNVAIMLNEASFNYIQSIKDALQSGKYDE